MSCGTNEIIALAPAITPSVNKFIAQPEAPNPLSQLASSGPKPTAPWLKTIG